jgi:hypothetical protein
MAIYLSKRIDYNNFTIKKGLYILSAVPNHFSYLAKKISLQNLTIKKGLWEAQSIPNYFVYRSRKIWRVRKV